MRLSKKDRDKLLILASMIAFVSIVIFVFHTTRRVPLYWIGLFYMAVTLICFAAITKKYLKLYGMNAGAAAYIPVINCINTFPKGIAFAVIVSVGLTIVLGIFAFVPAEILLKFMSERAAMNYDGRVMYVFYLGIFISFALVGAGYCAVYHDVRRMLTAATGLTRPKMECVNYPLLLIPMLSVLGYANILMGLNQLQMLHYSELQDNSTDQNLKEVTK